MLMIHSCDNGRGTAERLIAEIDRPARFNRINAVMVDDFNDISRTNAVCRLIPLVMIDQNDRRTLQIQQIALRKHSDIPSLLIQQRIVAHTLFGYRALYILYHVIGFKGDQSPAAHDMAHRHSLTDHLGAAVCRQRRCDDGNLIFIRQLADGTRDFRAEPDNNAARIHLNGAELTLIAVAENDHVMRPDIILQNIRIGCRNHHAALLEPLFDITDNQRTIQYIHQIAIACAGLRQCIRVLVLHIEARDITQRQQSLEMTVLIDNSQRLNIIFVHVIPCAVQRHLLINTGDPAILHIAQTRLKRLNIPRCFYTEALKDKFGLCIDMACPAGDIWFSGQPVLKLCITDRRADRICIRITVSDNKNRVHTVPTPLSEK